MNPSSHCRTSSFEEEFKFQNLRGDIHIHIATQNIFFKEALCQSKGIWRSLLTFGTETLFELPACMDWESAGSLKDESCPIG